MVGKIGGSEEWTEKRGEKVAKWDEENYVNLDEMFCNCFTIVLQHGNIQGGSHSGTTEAGRYI